MRAGNWPRAVLRTLRGTSRLVLASGALTLWAAGWFVVNIGEQVGPAILLWIATPLQAILLTAIYRRTAAAPGLSVQTRRFWRGLTLAAPLVGLGEAAQAYDAIAHPAPGVQHATPLMVTANALAMAVIIWSLHRLPLGLQTRGERLRVALDASTVLLATALFLWHFYTLPLLAAEDDRAQALVGAAFVQVLAIVAVAAVVKVVLSSYSHVDRRALRLFALAMLIGCFGGMPQSYLRDMPHLLCVQATVPALLFVAACAGEAQRAAARRPVVADHVDAERRPFSLLPYAAIAAVDGLLLMVCWIDPTDAKIVGLGAVVLTGTVVVRQITAFQNNRRLLRRLDHSARHDALTGLPNRLLFHERLARALNRPALGTQRHELSVALIDLDDFKAVNDTLGHETGDALLVEVASRLAGCVRPEDTVARLGGDEFVVLLDGTGRAGADTVAGKITAALRLPVQAAGHDLLIRASVGIADGYSGDDGSHLLRHADIAMYAAKAVGGSRHLHYAADMAGDVADIARTGAELRAAIEHDQFVLLYQPIIDLGDGRMTGVEALVRWDHPERGLLAPSEFIPVAERSGLIVPLGRWVIREACRQLAEWTREHGDAAPPTLNVNVSARELREPGLAGYVGGVLAEFGIAPARLGAEVTETAIFELGEAVTNLRRLREIGVRVSVDDFGTGNSTLTLLQVCPVDELKLDRSFTQAAAGDPPVMAGVIQFARALGLQVVAEGIETPAQADRLRQHGYTSAQGFHLGRPMPAAQLAAALTAPAALTPVPV
ncbi:MAG: hypothetical protein QOI35_3524 [Cryptosporangiaceae bacterium]|nr:hypothetical protein [Cryptosporangiaceae bacterium]